MYTIVKIYLKTHWEIAAFQWKTLRIIVGIFLCMCNESIISSGQQRFKIRGNRVCKIKLNKCIPVDTVFLPPLSTVVCLSVC